MTRFPRTAAIVILALAGLWLASSNGLRAQSTAEPQRQMLMVNEIQLKPDTAPEWAELQKSEVIPAQKKGGVKSRDVWAVGPGSGDPYLRVIVTPIESIAQFDNPNPMIKALGEQGAAALGAKNRRLVAGSHSTTLVTRPDLGFGTRPAVHKLAMLTTIHTANGRGPDFEALLKSDVLPALKKGGVTYYAVAQVVFGDDVNKYVTLSAVNDYAEIAKGSPLERALGRDGMARLTQKAAPLMTRLERQIIRYLPDLSFGPSGTTSH